jgi:hypothetical protein
MATKISVRRVNLEAESELLLALLQVNLPLLPHARRFQWLYRANPDGPAWSWFAYEQASGALVGVTSVFPRSMWVGNRIQMCGQVGDFAILATHRSLGPALMLQRATFEPVDQGILSFCYDCPPHAAGMATFRRLGVQPNCAVDRYALPLRLDRHLKKHLSFDPPILATLINLLLRGWRQRGMRSNGLEIAEFDGLFGDEFTRLDAAITAVDVIRGRRGAAQLNWRYRQDPLQEFGVMTARRQGELIACLVFSVKNEDIRIVELFGRELPGAAVALLDALAQRYQVSCHTIEAFLSPDSELLTAILKAHFSRRSVAAQVVAYAGPGTEMSVFLERSPRWAFNTAEVQA